MSPPSLMFRIPDEPLTRGSFVIVTLSLLDLPPRLGHLTPLWTALDKVFGDPGGNPDGHRLAAADIPVLAEELRELRARLIEDRREQAMRDGIATPRDRADTLAAADHAAQHGADSTRDELDALLALYAQAVERGTGLDVSED